jgi:hypothetical protein
VQGRPPGGARRRGAGESAARGKGQAAVDAVVARQGAGLLRSASDDAAVMAELVPAIHVLLS